MSHTVKLFERIINHMLRTIVELGNINFVFRRGRSTMDPAFVQVCITVSARNVQGEATRFAHDIRRHTLSP